MGHRRTNKEIVQALKDTNGLVSLAARRLDCDVTVIYRRAAKYPAIQTVIDECRDELVDHSELALRACILDRQPWAVALTLRTIGKHRGYVERQELTGADGGPIATKSDGVKFDDFMHAFTGYAAGVSSNGVESPAPDGDGEQVHTVEPDAEAGGVPDNART